jgi:hypothetical protein
MAVKQTKGPLNISTSSISRTFKIDPNLGFWFENNPSGNPGASPGSYVFPFIFSSLLR